MIAEPLLFAAVLGLTLLVVTGVVLQLVVAQGWDALDAAISHLAGFTTGCAGATVLAFEGAAGAVCWLVACGAYAVWMAGGYAIWTLRG